MAFFDPGLSLAMGSEGPSLELRVDGNGGSRRLG